MEHQELHNDLSANISAQAFVPEPDFVRQSTQIVRIQYKKRWILKCAKQREGTENSELTKFHRRVDH